MECHGMPWNAMETQGKLWKFIEGSRRSMEAYVNLMECQGSHMDMLWNITGM